MSGFKFDLTPQKVPLIETSYRCIKTQIPVPESIEYFEKLDQYESVSMHGQLPVVWDRAEGFQVYDCWGNKWIDFTSTIFLANAGHGNKRIVKRLADILNKPLLHTYTYATCERIEYLEYLIQNTPDYLEKAYLVSAGTEATEACVKLMRMHGFYNGKKRAGIIAFEGNWHGRTMGAQMLSSNIKQKEWIGYLDPNIYHLPFPYPWREDAIKNPAGFFIDNMNKLIKEKGLNPDDDICGFMIETFQGWGAVFYPEEFIQEVVHYAKNHGILISFDEMQAGFGRTGRLFGYMHYNVQPDLIACGKGASSSLPLAIVLGRKKIMDLPDIGSMSSTHSANPMVCSAGMGNLEAILKDGLIENSSKLGDVFHSLLTELQKKYQELLKFVCGKGLVAALIFIDSNGNPLSGLCDRISEKCMKKGLLVVHTGRESIKLAPPLVISEEALREGVMVLDDAIAETLQEARYDKI